MKAFLIAFLSIMLFGCAVSMPAQSELDNPANYGPRPADARQIVKDYMFGILKDPNSMQLENPIGPKQIYSDSRISKGKYGWGYCLSINAKNGFGAYTGFRRAFFLIYKGEVVRQNGFLGESDGIDQMIANQTCQKLGTL